MNRLESDYYAYMDFDPEHTREALAHYVGYFAQASPVVELACGRGEFLGLLAEQGQAAVGVDNDDGMLAAARAAGRQAVEGDAVEYLHGVDPGSVGGVFAAHLLEHLPPQAVERLIDGVAAALRPGGVFVAVVPSAASLSVLCHDFWRDPTHVRFYDPDLLSFFCVRAGLTMEHAGGNPANSPGPPPEVLPPRLTMDPGLGEALPRLVQYAVDPGARGGLVDLETTPWYQLGNLLDVLDRRVRNIQEQLASVQGAYDQLLGRLYSANEVYVVARG